MSVKMSEITDEQYQELFINTLKTIPAGGLFRLETDRIACLDKVMLESFARKHNVDLEVVFPFGDTKLRVVIPANFDIKKLLDEKGYCGFLRLVSILGATKTQG